MRELERLLNEYFRYTLLAIVAGPDSKKYFEKSEEFRRAILDHFNDRIDSAWSEGHHSGKYGDGQYLWE